MPRYRRRPTEVEAAQWFPGSAVRGVCTCSSDECGRAPHVHTMHQGQAVRLEPGDYVLPEPDGEHFYPCKAAVFEATYEPVG